MCYRHSSTRMHWRCTWERTPGKSRTSVLFVTTPTRSLDISSHTRRPTRVKGLSSARPAASLIGSELTCVSISSAFITTARRTWLRRNRFRSWLLSPSAPWMTRRSGPSWFWTKELLNELYVVLLEFYAVEANFEQTCQVSCAVLLEFQS